MHRKELLLSAVLIILFGFSVYLNAINGKFVWDDNLFLVENKYIKDGTGLMEIFTRDIGAGAGIRFNYYRPLQLSSYKLEYAIWGLDWRVYHITNIFLHILVALCVFYLAFMLFGKKLAALLAGLIFVLHPVQTESVVYISSRADLLCALFFMASFILYIRYIKNRSAPAYLLMIAVYLLALFSKENALMFIGVLFVYHYAFRERLVLRELLPVLGVTISYIFFRDAVLKTTMYGVTDINAILLRMPGFFRAVTGYLRLLFFPFGLHFDYGYKIFRFNEPSVIIGMILVFVLIIYAALNRRKNAAIFFSVCWFLVMLIPVSNIYPRTAFYMAEHHLYIPLVGFAFILSDYLSRLCRKRGFKAAALSIITALLVFYGYSTIRQNNYWLEPVDFYKRTLEFSPDSVVAHYNLGKEYERIGDQPAAILMYKKAIELQPGYDNAYNNLGVIYSRLDKKEEAIKMFSKVLEINPESVPAYINLGVLHYGLGQKGEALDFFKKARDINPEDAATYYNLAVVYYDQKEYGLAAMNFNRAASLGHKVPPGLLESLQPYRK
ncbi:MAG: tetratricopeptide repeat protein [Candidatus Omnitrophota bacterium]